MQGQGGSTDAGESSKEDGVDEIRVMYCDPQVVRRKEVPRKETSGNQISLRLSFLTAGLSSHFFPCEVMFAS